MIFFFIHNTAAPGATSTCLLVTTTPGCRFNFNNYSGI